jgi:hypothetical protein
MVCTGFDLMQGGLREQAASKPWIAVAGDGQFHAMILKPKTQDSIDWTCVMWPSLNEIV